MATHSQDPGPPEPARPRPTAHAATTPGGRKVLTIDRLAELRERARAEGRRVVHCHGCFDIVHPGHVRHLRHARSQGDLLLVSITGDGEMTKGDGRPLIPQELRAENLAELDCVDWVHIDHHRTAAELLERVRPDVYVKGREYESSDDPRFLAERDAVERHGGRVLFSSGDVVFSSTALIAAMDEAVDPYHRRFCQLASDPRLAGNAPSRRLAAVRGARAVIVGETIRDTYVFCDRPEIAGEHPMMTLRPLDRRHYDGGAAILARHAAALGARPVLVTALPDDASGRAVRARLESEGVEVAPVPLGGPIPEKQRYLVGASKVMKLDLVDQPASDANLRRGLIDAARDAAGSAGVEAAVVADFGLGLLTPALVTELCETLRPRCGVLAGDVSGRRGALAAMRHADLLTPSEPELRDAAGDYGDALAAVVWRLLERTRSRAAAVTMGPEGLICFEPRTEQDRVNGDADDPHRSRLRSEHVPAMSPHATDALGCGDALLATAALVLAAGGGMLEAAYIGSAAASIQSRRLGNEPVDAAAVRRELTRIAGAHLTVASPGLIETRAVGLPAGGPRSAPAAGRASA